MELRRRRADARASRPTLAEGIDFYAALTETACTEHGADLIALLDKATPVPGPVTDRFAEIAQIEEALRSLL